MLDGIFLCSEWKKNDFQNLDQSDNFQNTAITKLQGDSSKLKIYKCRFGVATAITTTTVKWFLDVKTVSALEREGFWDQSDQPTTASPKSWAVAASWKDWFSRN